MAHYAEIKNNIVVRVLVVDDLIEDGQKYLAEELQLGGKWVQTSYNGKFRGCYAGVGMAYDSIKDEFVISTLASESAPTA